MLWSEGHKELRNGQQTKICKTKMCGENATRNSLHKEAVSVQDVHGDSELESASVFPV